MADKPEATQRTPLSSSTSHAAGTQALSVTVEEEPGRDAEAENATDGGHASSHVQPLTDEGDPAAVLPEDVAAAWEEPNAQPDSALAEPVLPQVEPYTAETPADELPDGYAASDVFLDERRAYFAGDAASEDSEYRFSASVDDGQDVAADDAIEVGPAEPAPGPVENIEPAQPYQADAAEDDPVEPAELTDTAAVDPVPDERPATEAATVDTVIDDTPEATHSVDMGTEITADTLAEQPIGQGQPDAAETALMSETVATADTGGATHVNGTAPEDEARIAPEDPADDAPSPTDAEREKALAGFEQMTHDFRAMMEDAQNDAARIGVKLMEFAQANLESNADLARDYAGARSVPEIVNVHAAYFKRQMELLNRQAEELRSLTGEIASKKADKATTRTRSP